MTYSLKEIKNIQSTYVCFAINPFDVKLIFMNNNVLQRNSWITINRDWFKNILAQSNQFKIIFKDI